MVNKERLKNKLSVPTILFNRIEKFSASKFSFVCTIDIDFNHEAQHFQFSQYTLHTLTSNPICSMHIFYFSSGPAVPVEFSLCEKHFIKRLQVYKCQKFH